MTVKETLDHPAESGPFETGRQARGTAAVQAVYAAFNANPGLGRMAPHNHRLLCEAIDAAGVQAGAFDHRVILWLAGWEAETCVVIAGLIRRARNAKPAEPEGRLTAICGILEAFDWDAGDRQIALERIEQIATASRTASGIEPGGSATITPADLPTVLAALSEAADDKRDRAASCPDCPHTEGGLCTTCDWRLTQAAGYEALAATLQGQP